MSVQVGYSTRQNLDEVCRELAGQIGGDNVRLVIYFAAAKYDFHALSAAMQAAFPGAATLGCSTAGEIVSGHMFEGSVVAMALGRDIVDDVQIEVLPDLASGLRVPEAFGRFEEHFGTPMAELDFERYVGLVLVDGLSNAEERLMDCLGNLTDVAFIGGSAGDDLHFQRTYVGANGQAYSNAAVLALLQVAVPFSFIKTESFRPRETELVATAVDVPHRTVLAFDGKPAVEAYAEAVGVPASQIGEQFMSHPIGLMVGDEPYVRSPQRVQGEGIVFYCNIAEGMSLRLLDATDIVADTRLAVAAKATEAGHISGIVDFHCILRALELRKLGQTEAYGQIFSAIPAIGFATYGEEYVGHINQTSTMLVFH